MLFLYRANRPTAAFRHLQRCDFVRLTYGCVSPARLNSLLKGSSKREGRRSPIVEDSSQTSRRGSCATCRKKRSFRQNRDLAWRTYYSVIQHSSFGLFHLIFPAVSGSCEKANEGSRL